MKKPRISSTSAGGVGILSAIDQQEKRKRIRKVLQGAVGLIVFGGSYLIFFLTFGVGIPCIFYKLTGLQCPGCGMTRAAAALWKGNIAEAMDDNALCLTVLPALCLYLIYRVVRYINGGDDGFSVWEYILLILLLAVTAGYGVIRNVTI